MKAVIASSMLGRLPKIPMAIAIVALLFTACEQSQLVRQSAHPALHDRQEPIQVVAVAPFAVAQHLREDPQRFGSSSPEAVTRLLAQQVAESLSGRGARVVMAKDVRRALEAAGISTHTGPGGEARLLPPQAARVVAEKFGADALLVGELTRWAEREGQAAAATRGATVGFQVALFDAPGGQQLWSASFDQTQRPLSENLLAASRLPGGGTRWLTAEELARWGAQQTARQVPLQ